MIFTTTSMICICKRRDVYDGIHCVADLSSDGTLLRSYTWGVGIDNLLAVTLYGGDSTNTLYAVTDPLGTVHALVGTNGVPAVTYAYDSWGNLLSVSGDESLAASLRFTWQGREYSHAIALYNFRARWYDPASGRWLSKDPIGLEGGLNLYESFGDNPVCFRDFLGLDIYVRCENGHAELYIDNPQSKQGQTLFGFFPKKGGWDDWTFDLIYGDSVVELRDYKVSEFEDCVRVKTTPKQDKKALFMTEIIKASNLRYSVLFYNCSHAARMVLTAAGLPLEVRIFDSPGVLKKDVQKYLKVLEK